MDDTVSIFGGIEYLKKGVDMAIERGYETIFVITTCVSGIIGDDSTDVIAKASVEYPEIEFFLIEADGNIAGDYKDGFVSCTESIIDLIDPDIESEKDLVNLIGTSFFKLRRKENLKAVEDILKEFGLSVNCRFIDDCSVEEIKNFCKGDLDILISDDHESRMMEELVCKRTGPRRSLIMPAGISETKEFLFSMGRSLGKETVAKRMIEDIENRYREEISRYRKILEGKSAIVIGDPYSNIDWTIDMLTDLGMDILKIGITVPRTDKKNLVRTKFLERTVYDYTVSQIKEDVKNMQPNIIIGDIVQIADMNAKWIFLMKKDIGVDAPIDYAKKIANIIRLPQKEGWKEGRV